ncbi:MAG TPA: exodeoxyribonuclease III [Glutamicibacter sp.]|uniref:Exodeoxyribonuclease III n=1 Tax=Glutamicibacter arilaitensis (strain DSM 16368 / CIP 108037 / IAM 15318 / JCM 13566 / NCIMB 14258 / Re117) TaxID=861360 RepID=A0ABM9PUM5_GLUAR|nr:MULTISPECIES: exodeoxyribonuclease III [Glutamicibacter]CBT74935.1 exodeoxyribonuclease III [Glutamicibacter arilaitensis Re117]HCH46892.1 exodeoxyribonuclease III [Glutamicibacter sp.]
MIPTSVEILNKDAGALRVASVNVNGIRAAYKRNMADWIAARDVDILCLQEVRAPDKILRDLIGEGWHILHAEAKDKGRAGVAVLSRTAPVAVREHIGEDYFAESGRWVEADFEVNGEVFTVVSAYVHSGELGTQKQEDKYRFLQRMNVRLVELKNEKDHVLVVGDLNVVHTQKDIKNWKPNHNKRAGVMDEEIAYFDGFFGPQIGYKDVARELAGDVQGPYTWWSFRGQAFDNDAGWRIDYHMATPALAAKAIKSHVDRASAYDLRFSDHAPLVVDYQF